MGEELFEIEPGIFSFNETKPEPSETVVLGVQPMLNIPLDKDGMGRYIDMLINDRDLPQSERSYELGIKVFLHEMEWPLVTLEEENRIHELAGFYRKWGVAGGCRPDAYMIAIKDDHLRPEIGFQEKISSFLSHFKTRNIGVFGYLTRWMIDYITSIPPIEIEGKKAPNHFYPIPGVIKVPGDDGVKLDCLRLLDHQQHI